MDIHRYFRFIKTPVIFVIAALVLSSCVFLTSEVLPQDADIPGTPSEDAAYLDPGREAAKRAEDLLGFMTLDEKIGQMLLIDRQFLLQDEHITKYGLGALLSGGGSVPAVNTPEAWADMIDGYQKKALESRLSIPLLYGVDAVHGHNNLLGATIFPHNIGLGAAGNEDLVQEIARITALEAAASGVNWSFSPAVSVPQDIRWGRTYEGFSEDAELVSSLGSAYVEGMQGGTPDAGSGKSLSQPYSIAATLKHFIGDGATAGGRDQGDVPMTPDAAADRFGLPYETGIESGAAVVMASFNSISGEKVHGSTTVLDGLLRERFGFDKLVVSDWAAVRQLPGTPMRQLTTAVNAGIDMIMVPDDYVNSFLQLKAAVLSEAVSIERINEAVLRILELKFALGLFENPFAKRAYIPLIGSDEHRSTAREAVQQSLVILKNEDDLLPLDREPLTVLVTGSRADDIGSQSGGWTVTWQGSRGNHLPGTSIAEALAGRASGEESGLHILYRPDGRLEPGDGDPDVVIAVIGEDPYAEGAGDSQRLSLPDEDLEVLERSASWGLPVVTVLLTGRPLLLDEVLALSVAVIAAWLPGSEGAGIADVLFGDAPASGRLPFTWPKTTDALPLQSTEPGAGILFPQGFGITYEAVKDRE